MRPLGVLDLQGDVREHLDHVRRIGVPVRAVKHPKDFSDLAGLIIPGGESTCLSRLLRIFELQKPLIEAFGNGMKIWGTCAGAILLAKTIEGETPHLGLMDITVRRNAYGSQMDSFSVSVSTPQIADGPLPITFIRAPKIVSVGSGVNALLKHDQAIIAAEDERCLATTFHPELTSTLAFHSYFARKCGIEPMNSITIDPTWTPESWMR